MLNPHAFFHLKTFTVGLKLPILQYNLQWSPPHIDIGDPTFGVRALGETVQSVSDVP